MKDRTFKGIFVAMTLVSLALIVGTTYVAIHFLQKYW